MTERYRSKYVAFVKNEQTDTDPWFVYVEHWPMGAAYAARFGRLDSAQRVANAMNAAWEAEGRLATRGGEPE